jgi:hypothetical protein
VLILCIYIALTVKTPLNGQLSFAPALTDPTKLISCVIFLKLCDRGMVLTSRRVLESKFGARILAQGYECFWYVCGQADMIRIASIKTEGREVKRELLQCI